MESNATRLYVHMRLHTPIECRCVHAQSHPHLLSMKLWSGQVIARLLQEETPLREESYLCLHWEWGWHGFVIAGWGNGTDRNMSVQFKAEQFLRAHKITGLWHYTLMTGELYFVLCIYIISKKKRSLKFLDLIDCPVRPYAHYGFFIGWLLGRATLSYLLLSLLGLEPGPSPDFTAISCKRAP